MTLMPMPLGPLKHNGIYSQRPVSRCFYLTQRAGRLAALFNVFKKRIYDDDKVKKLKSYMSDKLGLLIATDKNPNGSMKNPSDSEELNFLLLKLNSLTNKKIENITEENFCSSSYQGDDFNKMENYLKNLETLVQQLREDISSLRAEDYKGVDEYIKNDKEKNIIPLGGGRRKSRRSKSKSKSRRKHRRSRKH